jgi:hypothetical protein
MGRRKIYPPGSMDRPPCLTRAETWLENYVAQIFGS